MKEKLTGRGGSGRGQGAPKENQNAAKEEGRKKYVPYLGIRWDLDDSTPKRIRNYIEAQQITQKEFACRAIETLEVKENEIIRLKINDNKGGFLDEKTDV